MWDKNWWLWNGLGIELLVWPVQPRVTGEWEMTLEDMMAELTNISQQYENGRLEAEAKEEWVTVEELLRCKLGRIADSWESSTTAGQSNIANIAQKVREQAAWIPWADRPKWDKSE